MFSSYYILCTRKLLTDFLGTEVNTKTEILQLTVHTNIQY